MIFQTFTVIMTLALGTLSLAEPPKTVTAPLAKGDISITNSWIRPAKVSQNTAVYMTLTHTAGQQDRLIKAECSLAEYVELHNHIEENGVMKMRPVQHIEISDQPVDMKPGALHVMLFKLKRDLNQGEQIPVSLEFAKAGKINLSVVVGQPEKRV